MAGQEKACPSRAGRYGGVQHRGHSGPKLPDGPVFHSPYSWPGRIADIARQAGPDVRPGRLWQGSRQPQATGFPIARIGTKLAVGYTLDELRNEITGGATPASFEPTIDYVVTKVPRFTFEKFPPALLFLFPRQ